MYLILYTFDFQINLADFVNPLSSKINLVIPYQSRQNQTPSQQTIQEVKAKLKFFCVCN